jgi:hypothetical protein
MNIVQEKISFCRYLYKLWNWNLLTLARTIDCELPGVNNFASLHISMLIRCDCDRAKVLSKNSFAYPSNNLLIQLNILSYNRRSYKLSIVWPYYLCFKMELHLHSNIGPTLHTYTITVKKCTLKLRNWNGIEFAKGAAILAVKTCAMWQLSLK